MVIKTDCYRDFFTGIMHPGTIVGERHGCLVYGETPPEKETNGEEEST